MGDSNLMRRLRRGFGAAALLAVLLAGAASGHGQSGAPGDRQATGLGRAIAAQEHHTDRLLARTGVVGTAAGFTEQGRPAVKVYTETAGVRVPESLDGVAVQEQVTGEISALAKGGHGGSTGLTPRDRWPRPVPIGISTGNVGECSAGTIGARVSDPGAVYALSNNHVYALENTAPPGSAVLQPGRYDTGCNIDPNNVIGELSDFEPILFATPLITPENQMDAAVASTSAESLDDSTPPGGYGTPKSATIAAAVGMSVQKYGRTTALTKGSVTAVNATIDVSYGPDKVARFVNQVVVESGKPFSKPGDSGSLIVVRQVANVNDRKPVGLLFAGDSSGRFTVANRIDPVLSRFGVTVDGQ